MNSNTPVYSPTPIDINRKIEPQPHHAPIVVSVTRTGFLYGAAFTYASVFQFHDTLQPHWLTLKAKGPSLPFFIQYRGDRLFPREMYFCKSEFSRIQAAMFDLNTESKISTPIAATL